MQTDNAQGSSEQPAMAQPTATIQQPHLDALFDAAARGEAGAQSALALNAIRNGAEGRVPMRDALSCAELWARMAAATGEPAHVMILAEVLGFRYRELGNVGLDEKATPPLVEHYLCLKIAADAGDPAAAATVRILSDIATVAPQVEAIWADIVASLPEKETASPRVDLTGEADKPKRVRMPAKPRSRRGKVNGRATG